MTNFVPQSAVAKPCSEGFMVDCVKSSTIPPDLDNSRKDLYTQGQATSCSFNLLKKFSQNDKVSLLIRHSNRYEITDSGEDRDVLLTEEGKTNAITFGKNLSTYKINKLITTSVDRCRQTAEYIVKGYGKIVKIEQSNIFSGLHISDWETADKFLSKNGYNEWYNRIINDIPTQGINTAAQYNKLMTNFLTKNTTENGLTIFISHDFLIAFYHYALNKMVYNQNNLVNYLSGLILKNGQYVAGFQNNK